VVKNWESWWGMLTRWDVPQRPSLRSPKGCAANGLSGNVRTSERIGVGGAHIHDMLRTRKFPNGGKISSETIVLKKGGPLNNLNWGHQGRDGNI